MHNSYLVAHSLSIAYKSGKVLAVESEKMIWEFLIKKGIAP